jgi:hypothetical protein
VILLAASVDLTRHFPVKNPALQTPVDKKAKISHNELVFLAEMIDIFRTLHIFI